MAHDTVKDNADRKHRRGDRQRERIEPHALGCEIPFDGCAQHSKRDCAGDTAQDRRQHKPSQVNV